MVNVGIGHRIYGSEIVCGVTRNIKLLVEGMGRVQKGFKFQIFSDQSLKGLPKSVRAVRVGIPGVDRGRSINHLVAWDQILLPRVLREEKIKVFHSPGLPIPCSRVPGCKFVLSIHDIVPWLGMDNDSFPQAFNDYLMKWLPLSAKKADKIISVSEKTREDVCRLLALEKEKVRVIYNGIDPCFRRLPDKRRPSEVIKKVLGVKGKYILNVNGLTRRKNVELLISAYKLLKRKRKITHQLVIVGSNAFHRAPRETSGDVLFTGAVSEEILLYLYNLADLFVFPSLYEGFGYPPLEAMACGAPVMVSNAGALPETVGAAGVLFDPMDVRGLAEKIDKVLNDRLLAERMISEGLRQVKKFSYETHIREVLSLYGEVAGR